MNVQVEIEKGNRGQFDVLVNGKTVVSRKGGFFAMLFRKPWPKQEEVLNAVKAAAS